MMITSAVEMMKVTVEIRTMESENRARNWARLEVQGYLLKVCTTVQAKLCQLQV